MNGLIIIPIDLEKHVFNKARFGGTTGQKRVAGKGRIRRTRGTIAHEKAPADRDDRKREQGDGNAGGLRQESPISSERRAVPRSRLCKRAHLSFRFQEAARNVISPSTPFFVHRRGAGRSSAYAHQIRKYRPSEIHDATMPTKAPTPSSSRAKAPGSNDAGTKGMKGTAACTFGKSS